MGYSGSAKLLPILYNYESDTLFILLFFNIYLFSAYICMLSSESLFSPSFQVLTWGCQPYYKLPVVNEPYECITDLEKNNYKGTKVASRVFFLLNLLFMDEKCVFRSHMGSK